MPRAGHNTLFVNGEVVVVGGHTSGFLPITEAEYYRDGAWHPMASVYSHDHGFSLVMRSGRVLLGGGHEKPLGIGQVHHVEWYDPVKHTFEGFGCLDTRRVFPQAAELNSGEVVISGNWYHVDNTELFDGDRAFTYGREVTLARSCPYIFPTSDGDALIFGRQDTVLNLYDFPTTVDRLRQAPTDVSLLATWQPRVMLQEHRPADCCIGNTESGAYAYLLNMANRDGEQGVVLVCDTAFTLLPLACPIPEEGPWGHISYFHNLLVDRRNSRGYMPGFDDGGRAYVLAVDYSSLMTAGGAVSTAELPETGLPLTLYYTDTLENIGYSTPVITDKGNMVLAGGTIIDNFAPKSGVYQLCLGEQPDTGGTLAGRRGTYLLLLAVLAIVATLGITWHRLRRRGTESDMEDDELLGDDAWPGELSSDEREALMQRVVRAVEENRLFLQKDLKIADVATMLGTNRRYISESLTASRCRSFSQMVNAYRVEYAKQLLSDNPEKKISAVCVESGFSNETSFFRTFKSFTGMTPKEWVQQQSDKGDSECESS